MSCLSPYCFWFLCSVYFSGISEGTVPIWVIKFYYFCNPVASPSYLEQNQNIQDGRHVSPYSVWLRKLRPREGALWLPLSCSFLDFPTSNAAYHNTHWSLRYWLRRKLSWGSVGRDVKGRYKFCFCMASFYDVNWNLPICLFYHLERIWELAFHWRLSYVPVADTVMNKTQSIPSKYS